MSSSNMPRPLSPAALHAMLGDGQELAPIDLREELIFSRNHLLWARNVPLSRLELRFAALVPRKATRIVLIDDNDGLTQRAAAVLARVGYSDLSYLDGGNAAWAAAGFELFSGVHVPSKAFGEFIEHASGTPSVSAQELDALMRAGTDMVVLDSRPYDEYSRISIPTGINVPGAELVLRLHDIAPSPDTLVVVNCAGRTRSIIGAQSLINAGVPNKVVALRNGTMGWHLAGLTCDHGKNKRFPNVSKEALAWAKSKAAEVARRFGIERIDRAMLERWQSDTTRTTYIFDVRDPAEYEAGHFPGALSAPGGQLVQATDLYAGTLRCAHRSVGRQRGARGDDRLLAQADGLEGRRRAAASRRRKGPDGRSRARRGAGGYERRILRRAGDRQRQRHRSLAQPELPQGPHPRRLVRDPLAARPRAAEHPVA